MFSNTKFTQRQQRIFIAKSKLRLFAAGSWRWKRSALVNKAVIELEDPLAATFIERIFVY
jgi:hypothetical protein